MSIPQFYQVESGSNNHSNISVQSVSKYYARTKSVSDIILVYQHLTAEPKPPFWVNPCNLRFKIRNLPIPLLQSKGATAPILPSTKEQQSIELGVTE